MELVVQPALIVSLYGGGSMKVLVISKYYIVREALDLFFSKNFKEYKLKVLRELKEIRNIDLSNVELAFIDTNEDIVDNISLIKESFKNIKTIVFNKHNNKNIFIKCLKNKIESCIFDINEIDELLHIVRTVIKGKKYYDLDILDEIMDNKETFNKSSYEDLTERESQVLHMVGLGYTNKEIAKKLYISEHTIKKHITSILSKLDMRNRKDLIIYIKNNPDKDKKFKQAI